MSLREKMDQDGSGRKYVPVTHPVFGEAKIRSLTEREWQLGFATWFLDANGEPIPERSVFGRVKLVQMCLLDPEDDSLVYTDSPADLNKLVDMRKEYTDQLYFIALDHNRPTEPKNGWSPSATTP